MINILTIKLIKGGILMGHFYDPEKNYPMYGKKRYFSGYETISEIEKKINVFDNEVVFKSEVSRRYSLDTHTDIKKYTTPEFTTITVSIPALSVFKTLMPRNETKEIYTVHADPRYPNQKILIDILRSIEIPEMIHPDGHIIFMFYTHHEYIQF